MIDLIKKNIPKIRELCEKHHVLKLYVFGSATNGDFTEISDLDFLYEFDISGINFDNLKNAEYDYADNFFNLQFSLENLFKRKVDLLPIKEITNKYFKESVDKTKQIIYARN